MDETYRLLKKEFEAHGQGHVFRWWAELNTASRRRLLDQCRNINWDEVRHFQSLLRVVDEQQMPGDLEPPRVIGIPKTLEEETRAREAREAGETAIRSGKTAAFVVAGGQGTRLGFDGPKGCFRIGPVTDRTLFQWQAERIRAASRRYGVSIPWFVMTSETNHEETCRFFEAHKHFGLEPPVTFFRQRMVPALDESGKLIMNAKDHIFTSPNGHGGSLQTLYQSGALEQMADQNIEVISYFQVDNVLIRIIDPVFIGYHVLNRSEMSSKMLRKRHDFEKLGVFGRVNGQLTVVEYSDMKESDMTARNADGSRKYDAGNVAIHLIDVTFARKRVEEGFQLPVHAAHKKISFLDESGRLNEPDQPNGYKFETFVFEALPFAKRPVILEVRREEEFSPVKNREGEDSVETARRDLTQLFRHRLKSAGIDVPSHVSRIEISPLFAEDSDELKQKLAGRQNLNMENERILLEEEET
ncbi:MAG TPA: UDPGP type 1 family protein [bacterium]|nr:UDPGP type 1 family protein [bacterium]